MEQREKSLQHEISEKDFLLNNLLIDGLESEGLCRGFQAIRFGLDEYRMITQDYLIICFNTETFPFGSC
jgi:hypothetical protein